MPVSTSPRSQKLPDTQVHQEGIQALMLYSMGVMNWRPSSLVTQALS